MELRKPVKNESWSQPVGKRCRELNSARMSLRGVLFWLFLLIQAVWAQPAWVLVHDGNAVTATGVPQGMADALRTAVAKGQPIKSVFFTQGGGWGVVYGRNSWACAVPPELNDLRQALHTTSNGGHDLRLVAVAPDSSAWALVYGDCNVVSQRCSVDFVNFFNNQLAKGSVINCLALGPGNRFFFGYNNYGWQATADNTMLEAATKLHGEKATFRSAWLANNSWGVAFNQCEAQWNNISPALENLLRDVNARNGEIKLVAVSDDASNSATLSLASTLPGRVANNHTPPPVAAAQDGPYAGLPKVSAAGGTLAEGGATLQFAPGSLSQDQGARLRRMANPPAPCNSLSRLIMGRTLQQTTAGLGHHQRFSWFPWSC